jgi:hypothetical protein
LSWNLLVLGLCAANVNPAVAGLATAGWPEQKRNTVNCLTFTARLDTAGLRADRYQPGAKGHDEIFSVR